MQTFTTATPGHAGEAAPDVAAGAMAGGAALRVLEAGGGVVEAVFRRSLYLRAGEGLLCAGDGDLVRGPLNLCLAAGEGWRFPAASASPGDTWRFTGERLCIGSVLRLRLTEPQTWLPGPVPCVSRDGLARGLDAVSRCTVGSRRGAETSAATDRVIAGQLAAGMAELDHWLAVQFAGEGGADDGSGAVLRLLGCGPGLTPSGDDILVGVLVTLESLGAGDAARTLAACVRRHVHARTGRISAAHLDAACDGQAVEPVHAMLRALAAGDPSRSARAAGRLLGYGQSSGADALAGIRLAASAWLRSGRGDAG